MHSPFYGSEEEGVCTDRNQTGQIEIRRSAASKILSNHESNRDSPFFDCEFVIDYLWRLLLQALSECSTPCRMRIPDLAQRGGRFRRADIRCEHNQAGHSRQQEGKIDRLPGGAASSTVSLRDGTLGFLQLYFFQYSQEALG